MNFTCKKCGVVHDLEATQEQLKRWKDGALIHRVFHYLSANDRELIVSGICGDCFDNMFVEEVKTTAKCLAQ